jgi:tetratricopeptide (TPR) repeat protein
MRFRLNRFALFVGILALTVAVDATPASAIQNPINVDTLQEGVKPRDNDFTGRAFIALSQGDRKVQDEGVGAGDDDYATALAHSMEGLTADPGNPQGLYHAARAQLGLRDFVAADSLFTEAVRLHPRYVVDVDNLRQNAWIDAYNFGLEASRLDNANEAIRQWERAGVIYRKRPEALLNLGDRKGSIDPGSAIENYTEALEILTDPGNRAAQDTATTFSTSRGRIGRMPVPSWRSSCDATPRTRMRSAS